MAEVMVLEGESLEETLKRLKFRVNREGTLAALKRRRSFVSPSQKRRAKSKAARKRQRKTERKLRYLDNLKRPENGEDKNYSGWADDTSWPVSLQSNSGTGRKKLSSNVEQGPTSFGACIVEYINDGTISLILVKNEDNNLWGFPGGSTELGEKPKDGAVRETLEETGFEVILPEDSDLVHTEIDGKHTRYFFRTRIIGGSPIMGEEILDMRLVGLEGIKRLADLGGLRHSHKTAFLKYLEMLGKETRGEAPCIA